MAVPEWNGCHGRYIDSLVCSKSACSFEPCRPNASYSYFPADVSEVDEATQVSAVLCLKEKNSKEPIVTRTEIPKINRSFESPRLKAGSSLATQKPGRKWTSNTSDKAMALLLGLSKFGISRKQKAHSSGP